MLVDCLLMINRICSLGYSFMTVSEFCFSICFCFCDLLQVANDIFDMFLYNGLLFLFYFVVDTHETWL